MAVTTSFYFVGNAVNEKMIQDIPIFAFTVGDHFEQGWESNDVKSKEGFRHLAWAIAAARALSIVVPQTVASQYFSVKQSYEKLVIEAYNMFNEGNYLVGESIPTVIRNVTVTNMKPIKGWRGLPALHENQRNHLDRAPGRWWTPVAISLFVRDAEADIVD